MLRRFKGNLSAFRIVRKQKKLQEKFIDNDNDRIDDRLEEIIAEGGYSYDEKQDIFYSNMNAWQRDMGYCQLYDEGSIIMGMIIDCEPIYFDYKGKRWLIEFWKGQYDLPTGAEIGVYSTDKPDIVIPDLFKGPFFRSIKDEEALEMSFTLYKKNQKLFTREGKHWWLTGFKLGLFSEPSELVMDIRITLRDEEMLKAFVNGLKSAGYRDKEISIKGNTVALVFNKPHTTQPQNRTAEADLIIQLKNKCLCDKYNEIVKNYDNFPDQVKAIYDQAPWLYEKIINMHRSKKLFGSIEKYTGYLIEEGFGRN